jgi:hypothetical protein
VDAWRSSDASRDVFMAIAKEDAVEYVRIQLLLICEFSNIFLVAVDIQTCHGNDDKSWIQ